MLTLHRQSVRVLRETLLEELQKNLELHKAQYTESVQDYEALCKDFSVTLSEEISQGIFENVLFKLQPPQSHVQKYKDVIDMLNFSVDTEIELDAQSFKAYIKNEWDWSAGFNSYATSLKSRL